jgi:hypothetical protein
MNHSELQKFARQLAIWTELIIENGRTPFRRVDLYPTIYTDQGIRQPPLVFWINRQSLMAGGILLLPQQDLDAELQFGRSCCDALGLQHFVTWENDRVRIWQVDASKIHQHQQFELTDPDQPDAFRHLLEKVLEALKMLAVIGLVPTGKLSPHYLHNLYQTTLELALPAQINGYRSQRAEEENSFAEDVDHLANEANRLLLLQLLGLAWHQLLPAAILPEKLHRAIELSLPLLPETLQQALSLQVSTKPPDLPYETSVCFHHLLLRMRQLSWHESEQRATSSIQLLIETWQTQQHPLPEADVQLYPQSSLINSPTKLILSGSPALLAAAALIQNMHNQPQMELVYGTTFQLDYNKHTNLSISGTLINQRRLSRNERQQYTTLLRTSWPNRRFRITSDKPLWLWEFIHLLGLSKDQQVLQLTLPLAVLESSLEEPFWQLLPGNYSIQNAHLHDRNLIGLKLAPAADQDDNLTVAYNEEIRHLSAIQFPAVLRNKLLLALKLPPETYQLLDHKLFWSDQETLDKAASAGLQLYKRSHFWHFLEQLLGDDRPLTAAHDLTPEVDPRPRPDILQLQELNRLYSANVGSDLDQLLADILELPDIVGLEQPGYAQPETVSKNRTSDKKLQEDLVKALRKEGIPTFPEQYLYFLDQPEMITYQLTPPLSIKSELLGQIELEDGDGQLLQVYGEELSNALLLCSELGKSSVELPSDREHLALLQKQYWKDLKQLHKQLNSLCQSRLKSTKAAKKLAKKVWKKLKLPNLS